MNSKSVSLELLESRIEQVRESFVSSINELNRTEFVAMVESVSAAIKSGNTIAFAGNGGSAAEAMHIAAEFTGKCVKPHDPWPVLCLNESQSALTAIGNDYGFDQVFSRMVIAHLKAGDILFLLSTSGTSENILKAIDTASKLKIQTYLWTGLTCPLEEDSLLRIMKASTTQTPRVQEIHLIWGHLLAELVEELNA